MQKTDLHRLWTYVFSLLLLGGFLAGCETSGPRWAEAEVRVNL